MTVTIVIITLLLAAVVIWEKFVICSPKPYKSFPLLAFFTFKLAIIRCKAVLAEDFCADTLCSLACSVNDADF